jgi:two-component system, NtrC family, sensor kinase
LENEKMTEKPEILGPSFKQSLPFLLLTVIASVTPFILNQIGFDFGSSKIAFQAETMAGMSSSEISDDLFQAFEGAFLHTILEWSAFCAAFFTVILFFANFTIKREVGAPILGVAFFCAGCMDAFHTLAADRLIQAIADNQNLVPFTWAICRLFSRP